MSALLYAATAAFNPGHPIQLAPNGLFDQEAAAKADILGAICTALFNLINNLLSSRTGQVQLCLTSPPSTEAGNIIMATTACS